MDHRHNNLLFIIVVRPMDSLVQTAVRHRTIRTAVICRNRIRTLMMVSRVRIIKMTGIKMIITSHVINGQINHNHMVVEVRLIVVPVHPDRIEIQARKMILVIKDHPKPNADQVIILEIKTKITLVVVIIIMVRKAVSGHLATSPVLVVCLLYTSDAADE